VVYPIDINGIIIFSKWQSGILWYPWYGPESGR